MTIARPAQRARLQKRTLDLDDDLLPALAVATPSPDSELGQNPVAEAAHVADRRVQALVRSVAEKADIYGADAELREFPDIRHQVRIAPGDQLGLSFDRAAGPCAGAGQHSQGDGDFRRVAPGLLRKPTKPDQAGLETAHRVHRKLRVGADRIPAMGVFGGAAQRRPALAADPDRDRVLHRLRDEHHVVELYIFAGEFGKLGGPEFLAGIHPFVGNLAAVVERRRADRLEFFATPADSDAARQAAFGG